MLLRQGRVFAVQRNVDLRLAPAGSGLLGGFLGALIRVFSGGSRWGAFAFLRLLGALGSPLAGFLCHLRRRGAQHDENAGQQADDGQNGKHGLAQIGLAQLRHAAADNAAAGERLARRPQSGGGQSICGLGQQQVQQAAPQHGGEQGADHPTGGLALPMQQQE